MKIMKKAFSIIKKRPILSALTIGMGILMFYQIIPILFIFFIMGVIITLFIRMLWGEKN